MSASGQSTHLLACLALCRKYLELSLRLSPRVTQNHSHASIDPTVRAARGLPEDLIRLCVGIEDPEDLIDDLENAIVEAGITLPSPLPSITEPFTPIRGEPWAPRLSSVTLPVAEEHRKPTHAHWFVSAPGKIILFGEHAVVHGVVSHIPMFTVIILMNL